MIADRAGSPEPWTRHQRWGFLAASGIGAGLIVAAWFGARGVPAPTLSDQVRWLNVAVVGFVVGAASAGSWLLVGRRAVGRRLHRVLADQTVRAAKPMTVGGGAVGGPWLWVPGTRRAHRGVCLLLEAKTAVHIDLARICEERLLWCEICAETPDVD